MLAVSRTIAGGSLVVRDCCVLLSSRSDGIVSLSSGAQTVDGAISDGILGEAARSLSLPGDAAITVPSTVGGDEAAWIGTSSGRCVFRSRTR
jgi:hypothetical protein